MNTAIATGVLTVLAMLAAASTGDAQPAAAPLKIEPHFIDLKETAMAGIATFAGPQSGQFPELWHHFPQAMGDMAGLETDTYAYGLELYPPHMDKANDFSYMACLAVSDARQVSLHLLTRTLPAAHYAVFPVPGSLQGLGATFHYIYSDWLPNSAYQRAFPFDLERYDVSPAAVKAGNLPIEILLPVVLKK